MHTSTRFAVAVHILTLIAVNKGAPVTSQRLALSAATNAAVIRRLLGLLFKAEISVSKLGKGGGATLARAPKRITLLEIYHAVEAPGLVAMPRRAPAHECLVGRNIQPALSSVTAKAEAAFFKKLEETTLKDVVKQIKLDKAANHI